MVTIEFKDTPEASSYSSDLVLQKPEIGVVAGGGSSLAKPLTLSAELMNNLKDNGFVGAVSSNVHIVLDKFRKEHEGLLLTGTMGTMSLYQVIDFLKRTPHVKKLVLQDLTIPDAMVYDFVNALKLNSSITVISFGSTAKTSSNKEPGFTRVEINGNTVSLKKYASDLAEENRSYYDQSPLPRICRNVSDDDRWKAFYTSRNIPENLQDESHKIAFASRERLESWDKYSIAEIDSYIINNATLPENLATHPRTELFRAMRVFGEFTPMQFNAVVFAAREQVQRIGENDVKGKTISQTLEAFEEKPTVETATRLHNALNIKRPMFDRSSSYDVGDLNKAIEPSAKSSDALARVKSAMDNAKAASQSNRKKI